MNVNGTRIQRPSRMEEAPGTRPGTEGRSMRLRTPSEVLAILKPTHDEPAPIMIGGLWKTGTLPEGAVS